MRATMLFVILMVFIAVFLPLTLQYYRAPAGTTYTLGDGYMPDYYQYLSWIKSGQLGHLLINSRYASLPQPGALVHPLFAVTGMITGAFGISTPVSYLLLRMVATLVFLLTLFRLIKTLFPSVRHQTIGLLLFLFGMGFETVSWSGHFGIISKYSLPPHHLLALAAWMGLVTLFPRGPLAKVVLMGWIIALLNPSIFLFSIIFLFFAGKKYLVKILIFCIGISPILFYNIVVLKTLPPWSIMYARMLSFNPPTTFFDYVLSLFPLLPLSLLGAWMIRKNLSPIHKILISWAYLPILLFPLVGIIPINYSRLLQTYQYIPITILAVSFIRTLLASQGESLRKFIGIFLMIVLIVYSSFTFTTALRTQLLPHDLTYYNVFVPKSLIAAFGYLDQLPKEQVVLSGEYVSGMIPAFTKHRAVIGRDDVIADYYPLRDRVFAFLDGRMTETEALEFVQEQKIQYVIFGIDTKPLADLPTKNYHFLVPVFTNGSITIVRT